VLAVALVALAGCGGSDGEPLPDGAMPSDGGTADGNVAADGGPGDGGPGDAGRSDAGPACAFVGLSVGDTDVDLDYDGRTRTYHVHVPTGYDASEPLPVVLNFHGFSSDALQQMVLTRMNDKADAEGFLAVHPEGFGLARSWNGGACCGEAADMGFDDVGLVRAIVADLATRVCLDRSRVYATGMSNGGFLSHRLACEAADLVAAIAPVAGVLGIPPEDCAPSRPIPVMHFHGTADPLVPWAGSSLSGFPSVPDTIAGWVARDGCTGSSETTFSMGDSTCETWSTCDAGTEVTLCTVTGGGHWWPGGVASGAAIVATDHMWEFFTRYRLP